LKRQKTIETKKWKERDDDGHENVHLQTSYSFIIVLNDNNNNINNNNKNCKCEQIVFVILNLSRLNLNKEKRHRREKWKILITIRCCLLCVFHLIWFEANGSHLILAKELLDERLGNQKYKHSEESRTNKQQQVHILISSIIKFTEFRLFGVCANLKIRKPSSLLLDLNTKHIFFSLFFVSFFSILEIKLRMKRIHLSLNANRALSLNLECKWRTNSNKVRVKFRKRFRIYFLFWITFAFAWSRKLTFSNPMTASIAKRETR